MLVFGEEGYAKATLAQVARKAGISAATVSHYFGSKAALFEAMVSEEAMVSSATDAVAVRQRCRMFSRCQPRCAARALNCSRLRAVVFASLTI